LNEVPFRVLDLNLLRVFDALLSEHSVNGAAARLSITPSAVSHALGRLRYLLKDQLFVRGQQGMQATPRAAEIGPRLREGLHQLEMALAPVAFIPAESDRAFTVACSGYICAILLPEVIARMHQLAPRATISVRSWASGVVDDFDGGRIDVLIGEFTRVPERHEAEPLLRDHPVWVLGRDYLVPKSPADRIAMLPRLASIQEGTPKASNGILNENGLERRVALDEHSGVIGVQPGNSGGGAVLATIPYSSVAPLIVKHADMAALLPRRLAKLFALHFDLDLVEPEPAFADINITALWHREHGQQPAVAWFRDLWRAAAATL
jgi:DNA-binding transcriptional LysR family regulator